MSVRRRLVPMVFVAFALTLFVIQAAVVTSPLSSTGSSPTDSTNGSRMVDIGDGQQIELGPGEELHEFVLTDQGWTEWSGTSSYLQGGEYGNRTDRLQDQSMEYHTDGTTTNVSVDVPTGTDWEAYYTEATITDLTENRTWIKNDDFATAVGTGNWSLGSTDSGSSSTPISSYNSTGDASGGGCLDVEISSNSAGPTYWYDSGDYAYASQSMTVDRGSVVWAGLRLDYWAQTKDDSHYNMTGSFAVYARVEGSMIWQLVFDDIAAERTWFDSGLVSIPTDIFTLTTVDIEIGLWSKQAVGYEPEIGPTAKFDNVRLYLKTLATPSNVNLQMNGVDVTTDAGWGTGHIFQTPSSPWTTNPVKLNFTWTPTPSTPDPNRLIQVEFDVAVNTFARRTGTRTVYDINPTAYGESYTVQNGTDASFSTFFLADIPSGYPNRYFFNQTIPLNRDVYSVARPLDPATNLTTGWSGGDPGDGYLNVSAYQVTTEAGRYGYWRILSTAPNMISDVEIWNPSTSSWTRTTSFRADDTTQVRINVGTSYTNSVVNITVFDPNGSNWYSVLATVDGSGYALSPAFTLAGANASAGSWMIQAFTDDSGTNTFTRNIGFFKRPFNVIHSSNILISYPSDAVGTWVTNVTYGDLVLVILKVNDTDSDVLVPGGSLQFTWAGGSGTFDDSGNGEYTKVVDTTNVTGKGAYTMDFTWTHGAYDLSTAHLVFNIHYDATVTSPEYPGISDAIGKDQSFDVNYTNVNGTGITGATISCNWTGSYSVVESGNGIYHVTLDMTGVDLGEYPLAITASASFVLTKSMILFVEVREIYNTISYTANQLSIPVGESASFSLTWTDTDSNQPITGSNSSIVCNWTSFHSAGEKNYTVIETSPGTYEITIFTESDDPLTAPGEYYVVNFTVTKGGYQNHTFTVDVQVRSHNTMFVLDSPVEQTPYQNDIVILVEYRDTDLGEGIVNSTGYVRIEVSSPTATLSWNVAVSSLGAGHYNITLKADQWGTIGWKDLRITVRWTDPGTTKYKNGTIDTSVRVLGTDTDLYLEQAPTAKYYLENFTFTAVYLDVVNSTRISNGTNGVLVSITPLTAGHPVTQADFVIMELSGNPGTYEFRLNSSLFNAVGSFVFRIEFMWKSGQTPLYENKTMDVALIVLERPTYVDNSPVQGTPYGELANLSFSYVDSLSTVRIGNSSSLTVSLSEGGVVYALYYDSTDRLFTMAINTSSLGGIGTFTLHLNIAWSGSPFYEDVASFGFTVYVSRRNTQLSHILGPSVQWKNNVTLEFVYTDLVSGSSANMVGILTLNASLAGWYTVTDLGNGHYSVELNSSAFASDGTFILNVTIVYTGSNYEADATDFLSLSVSKRVTQLGYDIPDPTPYEENVSFVVTYTDDTTGSAIAGATVVVSCSNSSSTLDGTNYWVSYIGNGQYRIEIDSVALGSVASFPITVALSRSGAPFYQSASKTINARVIQRYTQIVLLQTPGKTPFKENVTFTFKFSDFLTGDLIAITKSHITLSHGTGHTVITDSNYALINHGTSYEISFNSTLLSSTTLVTNEEIQLAIDRSSGAPYYAPRSTTTTATTVERPTQIFFSLVESTPYLDNMSIVFQYIDYISDEGISGAAVVLTFVNVSSPTYYLTDNGNGSYTVLVPTDQFGGTGSVYFNLTASKSGSPFYRSRTITNVVGVIRLIQTNLISEAPPAATLPIGEQHIVNVTFYDVDHDVAISGATVATDWYSLYGTSVSINYIGGGIYQIAINTTGLLAQAYPFTVNASLSNYRTAEASVTIQPGALTVEIYLEHSSYYDEWGAIIPIRINVREPYHNTSVPEMTAQLLWNITVYNFTDLHNGTYILYLDTTTQSYGTYDVTVRVSREFYQTRSKSISIVLTKVSGTILPQSSSIQIVASTSVPIWVYLEDNTRHNPVNLATVTITWNDTAYVLTYNGTPGYYSGIIDASGFAVGQYQAVVRAVADSYSFLDIVLDVTVSPVYTGIWVNGGAITMSAYYGDIVVLTAEYNDTYLGERISGASVSYKVGGLSGFFVEQLDHTYRAELNARELNVQSYQLLVSAAKTGYAISQRTISFNVLAIPVEAVPDAVTKSGYHGDTVIFTFYLNNTHDSTPVMDADVTVNWDGGVVTITDLHNGTYTIALVLNMTVPRTYDVDVEFAKPNHNTVLKEVNLVMTRIPATIQGLKRVSVPINESSTLVFTVINSLTGEMVTGINGYAIWETIGSIQLVPMANGSYSLVIPDYLPIDTYSISIAFDASYYQISPLTLELVIRPILTTYFVATQTIKTVPGATIEITIQYWDLDHNVGIDGITPLVTLGQGNLTYFPEYLRAEGNGTYVLSIYVGGAGNFPMSVTLSKTNYATQQVQFVIQSSPSAAQVVVQTAITFGSISFVILAALLFFYVKVYSVPQMIRWLNAMIRVLRKGRIPRIPPVASRQEMILDIVNTELEPVSIKKDLDDIDPYPIKAIIPEVDELLARLAEITGLGDEEIEAFKADLARMKASERPGFLKEVITQEEARRAESLATAAGEAPEAVTRPTLSETPSELEELQLKLEKKGMTADEIEIILEQAKSLSKADLDALLDSLGIDID
ncbi:MAG: hypothetical protein ACTSYL_08605 [Candidatus Thorarchaeota archaeon]